MADEIKQLDLHPDQLSLRELRNNNNENYKKINDNNEILKNVPVQAEEALTKATTAETNSTDAKNKANSVQAQFNQVVIEGDSSVEAAQARVKADATSYPTLQARLNATDVELAHVTTAQGFNLESYVRQVPENNDQGRLNRAIEDIKTLGKGVLVLPKVKEYLITGIPSLPSNFAMLGGGTLKLVNGTINSVLKNDHVNGNDNIIISDIVIDANYFGADDPAIQQSHHALYFKNITNLTLMNVTVKNPVAWCANIHTCDTVFVSNYRAFSTGAQQDGIHFMDCKKVLGFGIHCEVGDDVLGITVTTSGTETSSIIIHGLTGSSVIGSGVRINQSDDSFNAGQSKIIRGIKITGINIENCGSRGLNLYNIHPTSTFEDVTLEGEFKNIFREGFRIVKGKKLKLDLKLTECGTGGFEAFRADEINESEGVLSVYNVKDGYKGIWILKGNDNDFTLKGDYINVGKSNHQMFLQLDNGERNQFRNGNTKGGLRAFQIGTSSGVAKHNKVHDNIIRGTVGNAIEESSHVDSDYNEFYNNNVDGTPGIQKRGANSIVRDNTGYRTRNKNVATIANGGVSITVNHGLKGTPSVIFLTGRHTEVAQATVNESSINATSFQIIVPSSVTANRNVSWIAEI